MRVLKWTGHVGTTLVVPVHPDAPIAMVGQGPGHGPTEFGVWILDTGLGEGTRDFQVYGTGHDVPEDSTWRGSWVDGPFVWHLFERGSGSSY